MKNFRLISALLTLLALSAGAAVNTYTLTVTNLPLGGPGTNITANGVLRNWTNATTASSILTNLSGTPQATTNLFAAYGAYPQAGIVLSWSSPTSLVFRGGGLTLSVGSGWASVTTNIAGSTNLFAIMGPSYNVANTNRTNFANAIIDYAGNYASTNFIPTNATAFSNLVSVGLAVGGGTQHVYAPKTFHSLEATNRGFITGGTYRDGTFTNGTIYATNGYLTNLVLHTPKLTNGVNYGAAFRSPGGGTSSEQFGTGATASTNFATAVGASASALHQETVAVGTSANAAGQFDVAVGGGASATGGSGLALGENAEVTATNGIAIGKNALVAHQDSVALGVNSASTTTNQVSLGRSDGTVLISGLLTVSGVITNTTFGGTNQWRGDVAYVNRAVTSLANGNNAGVVLGTNVTVHLSGAAGAHTNCGFAATRADDFKILRFANPGGLCVVANQSGVEPVAANRIVTGTGGELVLTNQPAWLQVKYNGTDSRWEVITHSR